MSRLEQVGTFWIKWHLPQNFTALATWAKLTADLLKSYCCDIYQLLFHINRIFSGSLSYF